MRSSKLFSRLVDAIAGSWGRVPPPTYSLPDSLKPRCSVCGAAAVGIELTERSGGWHLRFEGAAGGNGQGDPISAERAQAILDALTPPYDAVKIQAAGFYDDLGFCTSCAKFYCPTHWNVSSTGGGTCPAGHFKSLDPHWHPDWDEL